MQWMSSSFILLLSCCDVLRSVVKTVNASEVAFRNQFRLGLQPVLHLVPGQWATWPQNAPRHSFCSYHLAMHQNAGKTALEAGHSEQMLFAHYREIVTREDAAAFWGIRPK